MNAIQPADLVSAFGLFAAAVAMAGASLWAGGRLAPWFLSETISAPSVGALFLSTEEGESFLRVRMAACGLAFAVMLAGILAIAIAARLAGWSPSF